MIENIKKKLSVPINKSYGIKRYENDSYIDGNPWIVTTLWLSEACNLPLPLIFLQKAIFSPTHDVPSERKRAI